MAGFYGLHLGNTNICLSSCKEGNIEVIANELGDRVTPAVLSPVNEDEYAVGLPAKLGLPRNSTNTIVNNLQFLNVDISESDYAFATKSIYCPITCEKPVCYDLTKDDYTKSMTALEANNEILMNVLNGCHAYQNDSSKTIVASVPSNFSKESIKSLINSVKTEDIEILQIINNTAAAALAYDIGLEDPADEYRFAVIRIGGLTTEIALYDVDKSGIYICVYSEYVVNLGGNRITSALCDYIGDEFYRKYKLDLKESRRSIIKLKQYADECKHTLSTMPSAQIFIESLIDGIDWNQSMSRARFESILGPILTAFKEPIDKMISQNNDKKIKKVIFCGGTMKIPKLQTYISELFTDAEILSTLSPDEVISMGCARQCYLTRLLSVDFAVPHLTTSVETNKNDIFIKRRGTDEEILLFPHGPVFSHDKIFSDPKLTKDEAELIFELFEKDSELKTTSLGELTFKDVSEGSEFVAKLINSNSVEVTILKQNLI